MRRIVGPAIMGAAAAALLALTAGQALATHVRCGDVITQDTTLDTDLVDCPSDGLVIGADKIKLDLNGYTIDGIGTSFFHRANGVVVGTFPSRFSGVTVENGSIQEFAVGVAVDDATDSAIRKLAVSDTLAGIDANAGDGLLIERNSMRGTGIHASDSRGTVIERNWLTGGSIGITGGADALVVRNHVSDSTVGIRVSDASDNALVRNSVVGNGVGIQAIDSAYRTRVERNVAHANAGDGIQVECCQSLVLHNLAHANGDDGIYVAWGGVDEFGPDRVIRNTANDNLDLGIEAQGAGVVDGGGNRAKRNGNPLQCLNVVCK